MDDKLPHLGERKENERDVNYSRGRRRQRARNYRLREHQGGPSSTNCTASGNDTRVVQIPGFVYDPVRKRYFKEVQGHHKHFLVQTKDSCEESDRTSPCKESRLHYLKQRERNFRHNHVHFKRKGLEEWARNIGEKKSIALSNTHPCPAFKGSLSCLALSNHTGKLVTISKLPGLGCNTIHIYDIKDDKDEFINLNMLATIIASEVTNVEWHPKESMKNYFLLNLLGCEDSKGSAVVCKFDESLQSCELNSYPLANGTAWHCGWSGNPHFSNFLGIAGSKQAVLVDSEKKSLVCKIRSSSDVFCIKFGEKSPVAYLGCRNGNIMCVDIRVKNAKQSKPFNVSGKVRSSATWMKVMEDENYLMASSVDGMIKMWDIRLSKQVKEYHGNVNETKLIPFVIDSSENILASSGHDGQTRIWSIQTCELLNTINVARNNEVDIPPVCLGENWALRNNMMAFGLGTEDKLKLYY